MNTKTKKILIQLLKVAFSGAIIFWLVKSDKLNFSAFLNLLSPSNAAMGLSLIFLNFFLTSERWRCLIQSQGLKVTAFKTFKLTLTGGFFNFAMPGGVGGDVIKAFYFHKNNPGEKVVAITSVLMDRILGLYAMVTMAFVAMLLDLEHVMNIGSLSTLFIFVSGLFTAFTVGLALVFSKYIYKTGLLQKLLLKLPFSEKFQKLYESTHLYGEDGFTFVKVILLSFISQTFSILFLIVAGRAAGFTDVSPVTYFLVAPLGYIATALPISPAGVGVGQAAFYFLFNIYIGNESELGPTVITAFQVGTFIVSLLGAFFYLRMKDEGPLPAELSE